MSPLRHYYDDALFNVGNWIAGRYYSSTQGTTTLSSTGTNANPITTFRCHPIVIPRSLSIDKLGVECTTAGDTTAVARLGIYNDDGTNQPGTLLQDFGLAGPFTTTGAFETTTTTVNLQQGVYWLACAMQNQAQNSTAFTSAVAMRVINAPSSYIGINVTGGTMVGSSNLANAGFGFGGPTTSGALPSPFVVTTSLAGVHVIPVRVMAHCSA